MEVTPVQQTPQSSFEQHVFVQPRNTTFERWLAHQPQNRGIVPPWLDKDKAWPPMPEPQED